MDIEFAMEMFRYQGWKTLLGVDAGTMFCALKLLDELSSTESDWEPLEMNHGFCLRKQAQISENVVVRLTRYIHSPGTMFLPPETELMLAAILTVKLGKMKPECALTFKIVCDSAFSGKIIVHNVNATDAVMLTQVISSMEAEITCRYSDGNQDRRFRWGGSLTIEVCKQPPCSMNLS